jgi:hypothetical protein
MSDRFSLTMGETEPLVVCPPGDDGTTSSLTIQQAHAHLDAMLETPCDREDDCDGTSCDACQLYTLLNGIP